MAAPGRSQMAIRLHSEIREDDSNEHRSPWGAGDAASVSPRRCASPFRTSIPDPEAEGLTSHCWSVISTNHKGPETTSRNWSPSKVGPAAVPGRAGSTKDPRAASLINSNTPSSPTARPARSRRSP